MSNKHVRKGIRLKVGLGDFVNDGWSLKWVSAKDRFCCICDGQWQFLETSSHLQNSGTNVFIHTLNCCVAGKNYENWQKLCQREQQLEQSPSMKYKRQRTGGKTFSISRDTRSLWFTMTMLGCFRDAIQVLWLSDLHILEGCLMYLLLLG